MSLTSAGHFRPWQLNQLGVAIFFGCAVCSCTVGREEIDASARLRGTASLVEQVKAFGKSLGIEPTAALSQTTENASPLSMLWVWMQRAGTLALNGPVDIRMAIGFFTVKERLKLERVYRVDGYSVYYRQGNEFADSRSVMTVGFAQEATLQRVKIILHEDLHGDRNFALPWEIEEAIITPLGALAAVAFFKRIDDAENLKRALASVDEDRKISRELNELAKEAERLLLRDSLEEAKNKILAMIPFYANYSRQFHRQIAGQNPSTVLEAKLSHDLAYYRYFDTIVGLSERAPDLRTLIEDFKSVSPGVTIVALQTYLRELDWKYSMAVQ
jgi:hypothetical protein